MKKSLKIILIIGGIIIFLFLLLVLATMYYFEPIKETDYTTELSKSEVYDGIKFKKYLERDEGRIVYLADNLDEFYFYETGEKKQTLREYAKTWQMLDDIVKHITDELSLYGELNDGGTKIYKSEEKDVTVVVCHTISGNEDIFIGDYNMQFDSDSMCKR